MHLANFFFGSAALSDNPKYIKVLQRRATCNEKIGSWSALSSAQDGEGVYNTGCLLSKLKVSLCDVPDYNTLLNILPPNSPEIKQTKRSIEALKPRVEAAQKKETGEVLEKLKGLGNSILGLSPIFRSIQSPYHDVVTRQLRTVH